MQRNGHSPDGSDIRSLWAAIADREARLLELIRTSAQIVWVTDPNGNVVPDADPPAEIADLTWSAFTGISQQDLGGRGWAAAVHPEDAPGLANAVRESAATGNRIDFEFRIRHRSGEWRWMICRGKAVRAADGTIAGWIGTCTDITAARKTQADLHESQQRLLAALEASEMSTWIWRLADNTFWWDQAGEKLWGLIDGDNVGHELNELMALVHPDDRAAVARAYTETVATGIMRIVEFRTLRPDGRLQWLQSRGRVETDASGTPVQVAGAFIDVTRLRTAEESLRQAQKMQALGTLAGGIAHDFNNLLLVISGNASLGLQETDAQHAAHRSLQEIARAAARASDLVRRILAFPTRQPSSPAMTSLQPAIEEAIALLQPSVPGNVHVQARFADAHLRCTLARAELQQVVVNLVNNAIHAIGNASGKIQIDVDSDASHAPDAKQGIGRYARIVIRDSGHGMDAATRARIFDPFFTTKPTGQGTGLGLAVVHGVVESCGGAIAVDSEINRGTAFTLWLPLVQEDVPDDVPDDVRDDARAGSPPDASAGPSGRSERILYVDDDEAVNFLIRRLLERSGYRVTCCEDPREAQRLFTGHPDDFDIVVTDLSMPHMNGFELIGAMKAIRPDVPVIMTSGYVRDEDHQRAANLGIARIILKPNTVNELGRELDVMCAQLRAQRGQETSD